MREQREALAAVLAEHRPSATEFCVACDWRPTPEEYRADDEAVFRAHLADVILREWLPGALADERVVEAAREAVCLASGTQAGPDFHLRAVEAHVSTAALTAAVTALTEDDA